MSWARTQLSELSEAIDYGVTASANFSDGDAKFLRITDIQDNKVDWATVPYCAAPAKKLANAMLRDGDIVFARTGATTGKSFLLRKPPSDAVFASYLIRVRPSEDIHPGYLAHFFDTPDYWRQIKAKAQGAAQEGVNASKLASLEIPLPPLDEQKRIAAILDKADQLRQKRRQAIALLDSLTQSIFLETFGDPATNPKSWPVKRIGDLLDSANYGTSGKAGADGEFPILRMGNVTSDGRIDVTDLKYIDLRKTERSKYTVRRGDLLFNRTNSADLVGKTAVFDLDDEFAFAGYLVRARTNKKATPEFISAYLNSSYGKAVLRGMAKSIVGMANINAKEMQGIAIPAPPIELQRQFSEKLDRVKKMRQKFLPLVARGESLFFSLQHRAFSGQL